MDNDIVIFAGAGASKAVSPEKYPTTVEFFSSLPEEIKGNKFFDFVEKFISRDSEHEVIDIEKILWHLQELRRFCDEVTDQGTIVNWFFQENRMAKANGKEHQNLGGVITNIKNMKGSVSSLIDQINQQVYRLYSDEPKSDEIEHNWVRLFDGVSYINRSCEVFTTNYDLVIEQALSGRDIVDIGWRGSINRYLDTDLWLPSHDRQSKGLLTKLHGSINWSKVAERIDIGDTGYKGSHDRHVIIYPGFKGQPREEYFRNFHAHLESSLAQAKVVLFIGFAFRDEYINEIMRRSLKPDSAVCVIDPNKIDLPFNVGDELHLQSSFNASSVDRFIDYAKRFLGVDMLGPLR